MKNSLSVHSATDAAAQAAVREVAEQAASVDGYRPFNEQAMLDIASGRREPFLLTQAGGEAVGAAILGAGELDLVVVPGSRRRGVATAALPSLLDRVPAGEQLFAWAHGDHPGAAALAVRFGFASVRTLLQLRVSPIPEPAAAALSQGLRIEAFRPGVDADDWVALNALVFAHHPEQGALTATDLAARQAEPWFDAGDLLVARDAGGRMIGYNWLKIEPGDADRVGEIYVIGVHPDAAGQGLGRALMNAGLARLLERGCQAAALYVEADNEPAVRLYRSLGFTDFTVDVQYRRDAR
ncbi:mycothiol synthase [Cryobacterium tepidiphilum]|uniref:Mycothiol acetyltransferase n=1 Tax=Cryobacterium tepidiphilum TaxID=2486026 RepID=A0A3M8LF14_9MICO|nr:mycothiol synthase [Cryobacterium tepidiphilum]RNE64040.1 mycothiol synthase [Cryobacterium tepidiphilum]